MARTFTLPAGDTAVTKALTVYHGERIIVDVTGLAPGAKVYLTISDTTSADPVKQFEGAGQIIVNPSDVLLLDEGRPYFYNIWQELSGDLLVLYTGQFLLSKSILPDRTPPIPADSAFSSGFSAGFA